MVLIITKLIIRVFMKKIFNENISLDDALGIYRSTIINDNRFIDNIDDNLLTVEECYMPYYIFECDIYNHPYFFKNNDTNQEISETIDIHNRLVDKDIILNEINVDDAVLIDEIELCIYDKNKFSRLKSNFIKAIKDNSIKHISLRHCHNLTNNIYIDLSPIKKYDNYKLDSYYEKIYIFRYGNIKNDYISILSSYKREFYKLDFIKNDNYLSYLKKYKKPIEYIPNEFIEYYYIQGFNVYLDIYNKLSFESEKGLLKKIKENINYDNYSEYSNYLNSGIYYFKINKYLRKIKIIDHPLKNHIYQAFLTLRYLPDSGIFLYKCANMGLLSPNDIKNKLKYLEHSYRLGSIEAKKLLYEYYSIPINYDYYRLKKYS